MQHDIDELIPGRWKGLANRLYKRFVDDDPVLAHRLRQEGYGHLTKPELGEEMLARYTEEGRKAPYIYLQRLQERTQQAIHPSMYTDAPPVPLPAVTLAGRAETGLENIWRRHHRQNRRRSAYWPPYWNGR